MLAILGGIAFVVVWFGAAGLWAGLSLMGGVMADDAGRVSSDRHATLLVVLLVGEAVVALAGIAGGAAFFLPDHRATLWWVFAGLVAVGAALQIGAVWSFVSAAS
jgi:hypothetical protein